MGKLDQYLNYYDLRYKRKVIPAEVNYVETMFDIDHSILECT